MEFIPLLFPSTPFFVRQPLEESPAPDAPMRHAVSVEVRASLRHRRPSPIA